MRIVRVMVGHYCSIPGSGLAQYNACGTLNGTYVHLLRFTDFIKGSRENRNIEDESKTVKNLRIIITPSPLLNFPPGTPGG